MTGGNGARAHLSAKIRAARDRNRVAADRKTAGRLAAIAEIERFSTAC